MLFHTRVLYIRYWARLPYWSRSGIILGEKKLEKETGKENTNALTSQPMKYTECFRKTLPKILRPTYATTGNTRRNSRALIHENAS